MTTNLKKITSAILSIIMLTSVSANAAEGVDEYLHSEAFSETVDVVLITTKCQGTELNARGRSSVLIKNKNLTRKSGDY